MKRFLLFVVILTLVLTACGPKVKENTISNLTIGSGYVEYDNDMYSNLPEPVGLVNYNLVIVSAPKGTELDYRPQMGDVTVQGRGTNYMTISLVKAPAQVEVYVTKCAKGNCPTKVHFEHRYQYPNP